MNATLNIDTELKAIAAALQPLRALEAVLESELNALESRRRTAYDFNHPAEKRETLRQLRTGVSLANEGVERRLWDVLDSPEMRRFKFHTPGIEPLERKRDGLIAEQQAAANPPAPPVLRPWRYTGKQWGKVAGMRRQTGDVIQLTEEAARRWSTVLELVVAPPVEAATASAQKPATR